MAIPMMIGTSAHMLLNIIDGIYVSRLGLEPSLAVLNYGFPFFYLIFAVFNGLTSGSSSVLARMLGAKQNAKAENALAQIVWVGLALFALFLVVYPIAIPFYLKAQGASPGDNPVFLAVAVSVDGQLHLGDELVNDAQLTLRAKQAAKEDPTTEVQLRADEKVPYGRVAELIGLLQDAGLSHIGFITAGPPTPKPATAP